MKSQRNAGEICILTTNYNRAKQFTAFYPARFQVARRKLEQAEARKSRDGFSDDLCWERLSVRWVHSGCSLVQQRSPTLNYCGLILSEDR